MLVCTLFISKKQLTEDKLVKHKFHCTFNIIKYK